MIAHLGCAVRKTDGLFDALHAGANDQQFLRRGVLRHQLPERELLVRAEKYIFTCRPAYDVARERGLIPLLNVVLHFGDVEIAGVIERSCDWRVNAL